MSSLYPDSSFARVILCIPCKGLFHPKVELLQVEDGRLCIHVDGHHSGRVWWSADEVEPAVKAFLGLFE